MSFFRDVAVVEEADEVARRLVVVDDFSVPVKNTSPEGTGDLPRPVLAFLPDGERLGVLSSVAKATVGPVDTASGGTSADAAPGRIFFAGFRGLNLPFCEGGGTMLPAL